MMRSVPAAAVVQVLQCCRTVYSLVHEYSSVNSSKTPLHRASPQLDPQLSPKSKTHLNQQNLKITRHYTRTSDRRVGPGRPAPRSIRKLIFAREAKSEKGRFAAIATPTRPPREFVRWCT